MTRRVLNMINQVCLCTALYAAVQTIFSQVTSSPSWSKEVTSQSPAGDSKDADVQAALANILDIAQKQRRFKRSQSDHDGKGELFFVQLLVKPRLAKIKSAKQFADLMICLHKSLFREEPTEVGSEHGLYLLEIAMDECQTHIEEFNPPESTKQLRRVKESVRGSAKWSLFIEEAIAREEGRSLDDDPRYQWNLMNSRSRKFRGKNP